MPRASSFTLYYSKRTLVLVDVYPLCSYQKDNHDILTYEKQEQIDEVFVTPLCLSQHILDVKNEMVIA